MESLISIIDTELAETVSLCHALSKSDDSKAMEPILLKLDFIKYKFEIFKKLYNGIAIPDYREKLLEQLSQQTF